MKKSALTVGAITLLGQGIGLAAGSSSNPLLLLLWEDKSSGMNVSVTVTASNAMTAQVSAVIGIYDAISGTPIPHKVYYANHEAASGKEIIPGAYTDSVTDNQNGTYTIVFRGPITARKHVKRLV